MLRLLIADLHETGNPARKAGFFLCASLFPSLAPPVTSGHFLSA
jgi:hypothetical protein